MDNSKPLVSVLMSVRNSEQTVEKSIKSILNQSYDYFEFLIVDDCSTDSTLEKLKILEKQDSRISIFTNSENIGLTKSLNKLIKNTKGELIARQDSDDHSNSERIYTQVQYLLKNNLDAVTSRALIIGSTKKIPGLSYFIPVKLLMKFKNPFIHGSLIIKKQVLNDLGLYDENFYYAQDYKLYLDLLSNGYNIKAINKPLYNLNTINNISSNNKDEQKYYFNCARKRIVPVKKL
tara:strand:+ start:3143 stop:3844 length:702 start_codon:yes stop_codon:yes gene_type:complete